MSHRGKLLERLILNRLKPVLKELIPDNQFGFTAGRGCPDAQMISRMLGIDAQKRHIGLVRGYIDLTKAYDKVNREVLWKILRRFGIPEEMVKIVIGYHEGSTAVLQINGEIAPNQIPLNRGLKQGSVLSPILFNIFFGVLIKEFEKRCANKKTEAKVLGVEVMYNLNDGFLDDKQIQEKKPGYGRVTVVDVLYADDCILFSNTIRDMQTMVVCFDEVATIFGMELAIGKTKVVCNHFSKAMELEARKAETEIEEEVPQQDTRHSRILTELLRNDPSLLVPVIKVRGESIEVVSHFRYLGSEDKDDGSLGVEIQARICRMKQRFKEFEGRVLCNDRISTLPRMQVFKCVIMTNGTYACEVWNYTRAEIDRLEKHYFRLLRATLRMRKYDTTYLEVLAQAREEGAVKTYPIECFVQRQQLKFLWKVLHLRDEALQKIVLHGRLDQKMRSGRKRTYKQCITEALANFGVTMEQCMDTAKKEWTILIEEAGMDAAVHNWQERPKVARAIDVDWRLAGRRSVKRKVNNVAGTVTVAAVVGNSYPDDGEERDEQESASEGSDDDDEFVHIHESQEEGAGEEEEQLRLRLKPQDGINIGMKRRGNITGARKTAYEHKRTRQAQQERGFMSREGQGYSQEAPAATAWTTVTETIEVASAEKLAKAKARTVARHNQRNARRQRRENEVQYSQNQPRELQIMVGHPLYGAEMNLDHIPVHMRAVLAKTSMEAVQVATVVGRGGQ